MVKAIGGKRLVDFAPQIASSSASIQRFFFLFLMLPISLPFFMFIPLFFVHFPAFALGSVG